MNKLKIGIIGTGGISRTHMLSYKKLDNVEVVAACDINKERVEKFGQTHGITALYTDYNEMLAKENLDAVSVTTWNNVHKDATISALNSNVNVLCEKPMAMNTEEALEMQDVAKKSGKLLMIGFVRRFGANADLAKEFIDNGDLGELYYVKTKCTRRCGNPGGWFADKSRSGGGPIMDLGVHMIDLSRYLLGKPKAVSVYGATFNGIGDRSNIVDYKRYLAADQGNICDVEDFATALIRFDNGAVLHVEVSFSANIDKDELSLDILGTKGGIKIEPEFEIYSEKYNRLMNITPIVDKDGSSFEKNFYNELKHFIECIEMGTQCRSTSEDGVELMKILDAIYKSAETKKEVLI